MDRSRLRAGLLAMLAANLIWGFAPLLYRHLDAVPATEVMAHRTIWSFAFFALILALRGQFGRIPALVAGPDRRAALWATALIGFNWFLFIWAVQRGHAVEASLAYYISPLVLVLLGVLALGERLSRAQAGAVGLAAVAVLVLTVGLGVAPWIALALAPSFSAYALIKLRLGAPALVSVGLETGLLTPLALAALLWIQVMGPGNHFGQDGLTTVELVLLGPVSGFPLVLFSYGAQRLPMATTGLLQYLNPTLQALSAVMIMGDPFTPWHGAAFALIWVALAIYTAELWRQDRVARNAVPS